LKSKGAVSPHAVSVADGPVRRDYARAGIPTSVRSHPLAAVRDIAHYDDAICALAGEFRQQLPDAIYANTLDSFFVVDAARHAGIPCVWNLHESEPVELHFRDRAPWLASRIRECFALPYRLVFVSDASRDVYASLDVRHRSMVIHNALEPRRLAEAEGSNRSEARRSLGIAANDLAVLTLGTVCERKGQHDLVRAAQLLPPEASARVRYFIVGERGLPYGQQLRALVASVPRRLAQRISIVPETSRPGPYYAAADVFVCSSRVESFPRVILEAMAFGLPIVTTPVFGIREQVRDSVNGLFYTPGAVDELAERILRLVEDDGLRTRLGVNSRYALETLGTFDEMTEEYGQVLREAYLAGGDG